MFLEDDLLHLATPKYTVTEVLRQAADHCNGGKFDRHFLILVGVLTGRFWCRSDFLVIPVFHDTTVPNSHYLAMWDKCMTEHIVKDATGALIVRRR